MNNYKLTVVIFVTLTFLLTSQQFIFSQTSYGFQVDSNDVLITGRIDLSIDENNLFVGQNAGINNNSQDPKNIGHNTFLGVDSGKDNTIGDQNTFTGFQSGLMNIDGTSNTFIGSSAGANNVSGNSNVFVGKNAGSSSIQGSNVYIGAETGSFNIDGTGNTIVGKCAGQTSSGSGNVFIGAFAGQNEQGDHKLYISNGLNGDGTLIYGDFNNRLIELRGNVNIKDALTLSPSTPPSGSCGENGQLIYGTNDELYLCKGGDWKVVMTN